MLSSVSNAVKFNRISSILIKNCPLKYLNNELTTRAKFRGYFTQNRTKNWTIVKNINKLYHRTGIIGNSFQVTPQNTPESELDTLQFEKISDDTLDSLAEYFDEIVEHADHLPDADVNYGNGVLTIKFGDKEGTYVINRQTPNKQIWLSSPKSGPKRYDFINGTWIYKHDGKSLHHLLDDEILHVVKKKTEFIKRCCYSREK